MEVVFGMLFLTLSNANIGFFNRELTWRTYSTTEALSTIKKVQIIDRNEFAKAALDLDKKTFVVHITIIT